jgi:SNF2 family DNA or RNA helicase
LQARPTSADTSPGPSGRKSKPKPKPEDVVDYLGLSGEVLPSAKSLAVKAQVLEWIAEEPDVKIIIYTQWIPMIRILSKVAQTEGWDYCTYSGQMSHDLRDKAIREFTDIPEKRLLIASLKCGGLGLNIAAASRVILIDPWWNQAIEQQAFCRVFRIGQDKETRMLRLVVKNTIDE